MRLNIFLFFLFTAISSFMEGITSTGSAPLVLGIGSPIVDLILPISDDFLQHIPGEKGGSLPITETVFYEILSKAHAVPTRVPGGSCANTIKGLAALGCHTSFHGRIGNDETGEFVIQNLHEYNVKEKLLVTPLPTGQIISLVTPDGERTQRSLLQSSLSMAEEDLFPELFFGFDLVHIEGYLLRNGNYVQKAMELAKQAGAKISFDLGSYELVESYKDVIPSLVQTYVDILFANEQEAFALSQQPPEEACRLFQTWVPISVVLVGEKGCWIGTKGTIKNYRPPRITPIDLTGAGDLFASGFLYGYLQGLSLKKCAALGNRLGSTVTQYCGAEIPLEAWPFLLSISKGK